jgi:hypothetical protein
MEFNLKSRSGSCLGRFGGGANISKVFLGMDIPFRAKTRELEIGFFLNGIQKWDFFTRGAPADLVL